MSKKEHSLISSGTKSIVKKIDYNESIISPVLIPNDTPKASRSRSNSGALKRNSKDYSGSKLSD
jgi:hypothetical protein